MHLGPLSQPGSGAPSPSSSAPLYRVIARILHAHDPLGMRSPHCLDEYAPEAMAIVLRLDGVRSIAELRETIRDSLADWSDPLLAGAADRYREVAREVWRAWRGESRAARWRLAKRARPRRSPNSRPPRSC